MSVTEAAYVPFAGVDRVACPECGTYLRRGNKQGRDNPRGLCEVCLRRSTVPEGWNPRHDSRNFERTWLTHLLAHFGEWCHPSDLWLSNDDAQRLLIRQLANEVVCAAQRVGIDIESDRNLGYRITGAGNVPRWVREERATVQVPGQLTLREGEGVA